MYTAYEEKLAKSAAFLNHPCSECGAMLSSINQSKIYPAKCKPCTNPQLRENNKKSVERRLLSNVGKNCRECHEVVLDYGNQARSLPGVCKGCVNLKSKQKQKQNRSERLTKSVGKLCSCGTLLSEDTMSRSIIGACRDCATIYSSSMRQITLLKFSDRSCSSCGEKFGESNQSKSIPRFCKACVNKRHHFYYLKSLITNIGNICRICNVTVLDINTVSISSPKVCRSCTSKKSKQSFDSAIGTPCIKCSAVLTEDNQSKAHIGKCKPCRNSEYLCVKCGNKGGVYRGKTCAKCFKK